MAYSSGYKSAKIVMNTAVLDKEITAKYSATLLRDVIGNCCADKAGERAAGPEAAAKVGLIVCNRTIFDHQAAERKYSTALPRYGDAIPDVCEGDGE